MRGSFSSTVTDASRCSSASRRPAARPRIPPPTTQKRWLFGRMSCERAVAPRTIAVAAASALACSAMANVVIAHWTVRAGEEQRARELLLELAPLALAEPGCRLFQPTFDPAAP